MEDDQDSQGVGAGRFLQLAFIAVAAFGLLRLFVFEAIVIASGSMEPTLHVGTHAFLDKVTYRFRSARRGDIVSFRAPVSPREEMVKRIVAVGGDTVELREKVVILNGSPLTEHHVRHARAGERLLGDTMAPVTVPPGCLFVLGDNRDESNDSSVWKDLGTGAPAPFVKVSEVRGIVRGFF